MQNGILSIIHAINKTSCWQEALILYLVSENELLKPNQFHCFKKSLTITVQLLLKGL